MNDNRQIKDAIGGIFSRAAATYDCVGPRYFSKYGRRLVELIELPDGAKVLDVAAGRGAVLFPAAERIGPQGHVIGIDLAEAMVRQTAAEIRHRAVRNAEMRQMDAEQLDFADATFDWVLCAFASFFFPQLGRALAEFCRVLKPQGRVAITTWGKTDDRWGWYSELVKAYQPRRAKPSEEKRPQLSLTRPPGLEEALSGAGFAEIQVMEEEADLVYASEEEWWASLWSKAMRIHLEKMPPPVLAKFKADVFERMQVLKQSDGFHELVSVQFTFATKLR